MSILPPATRPAAAESADNVSKAVFRLEIEEPGGERRTAELRSRLAGKIGEVLDARLLKRLGAGRQLLELLGQRVVAEGFLSEAVSDSFSLRLESLEPVLRFSLPAEADSLLPGKWRQLFAELVAQPDFFSRRQGELLKLLAESGKMSLPSALRQGLAELSTLIKQSLPAEMPQLDSRLAARLGLLFERNLAAAAVNGRLPAGDYGSLKFELLRLLAELQNTGKNSQLEPVFAERLHAALKGLLEMVELNQLFNNSGWQADNSMQLLLPFAGLGSDLWLRLRHNRHHREAPETDSSYSLMIYLDLRLIGPAAGRLLASGNDFLGQIMVADEKAAQWLRRGLPALREQLRQSFSGAVNLQVENWGTSRLTEFQRQTFLAGLPSLFSSSG